MSSLVPHSIDNDYGYAMRSIRRPFSEKFPTIVGVIIGILQMLLNGAIVGLEGGSVAYNPIVDIVYAGFWCSFSFFFTWISMCAFRKIIFLFFFYYKLYIYFLVCFRKTFRWGLVVVGTNSASIAFGIILIVFDSLFIQTPCRCYLGTVCEVNFEEVANCTGSDIKLRIVKAQLACVVTMVVSNIGYIITFTIIVASSRVLYKPLNPSFQPVPPPNNSSPKVLTNVPIHLSAYQAPYQASYDSRYRQPIYPEQTGYWRPSTPYFNRIEKF